MNEWISVKNEYPEDGLDVLVLDYHGFMAVANLMYHKTTPWRWHRCGPKMMLEEITHWMELPKMPHE